MPDCVALRVSKRRCIKKKKKIILGSVGYSLLHPASSSCGEWGLFFLIACGLVIAVASLAEYGAGPLL